MNNETDSYCEVKNSEHSVERKCPLKTHRCVRQSYDLLDRTIVLENGYKCEEIPVVKEKTNGKIS